jgi:hypothetical protein
VINFPNLTYREYKWTLWKSLINIKSFVPQLYENSELYQIWGYDLPEVHVCFIYKNEVPQYIIDSGYSQAQNDADKLDFEANFKSKCNGKISNVQSPFADKSIGTKKIYKRVHGIQQSLIVGNNDIFFTISYPWVKITGIELIGGEILDRASFHILDTTTGTYSTVPNFMLNCFGFDVNMKKDYYSHLSEYDADLYQGMQIKIVYNSISEKTVGINFLLNEVK